MREHFAMMAKYNAWANARLYAMAHELPDDLYRKNVGAYFKSLHGTLNHVLVADRIWMHRLTGEGEIAPRLDAILFDDLPSLTAARKVEDERILHFVDALTDELLRETFAYHTTKGVPQKHRRCDILAHVFNHQTHHRGQAHAILTAVGVAEPAPLDLLLMQREMT